MPDRRWRHEIPVAGLEFEDIPAATTGGSRGGVGRAEYLVQESEAFFGISALLRKG
jgi:hypothetical protein